MGGIPGDVRRMIMIEDESSSGAIVPDSSRDKRLICDISISKGN